MVREGIKCALFALLPSAKKNANFMSEGAILGIKCIMVLFNIFVQIQFS